MSKSIHLNHSWQTRSANFSTHGSRNGNNLLGWGEKESMTPDQERDALVKRSKQIHMIFESKKYKKSEKTALAAEFNELNRKINELRPKIKTSNFENYIIEVIKEKISKLEWEMIFQEAMKRYAKESRDNNDV